MRNDIIGPYGYVSVFLVVAIAVQAALSNYRGRGTAQPLNVAFKAIDVCTEAKVAHYVQYKSSVVFVSFFKKCLQRYSDGPRVEKICRRKRMFMRIIVVCSARCDHCSAFSQAEQRKLPDLLVSDWPWIGAFTSSIQTDRQTMGALHYSLVCKA